MKTRIRIAQVAWLNTRFCVDAIVAARGSISGDFVSTVMLAAISNSNTGYLDNRPETSRLHLGPGTITDDMRRPVNVSSLASSLGVPRETARLKVAGLVDRGLAERIDGGVIIPSRTLNADPISSARQASVDAIVAFVAGLTEVEGAGMSARQRLVPPTPATAWGTIRLAVAHMLRVIGHARELAPAIGFLDAYILLGVAHLTSAQLRIPTGLAEAIAPESFGARIGHVRGAAVADLVHLPEETVRRHLKQLVDAGVLSHDTGGYDVILDGDRLIAWRDFQAQVKVSTRQFVWKLDAAGLIETLD
ncbi:hypothetical protein BH09PSE1_BH09PSE1_09510 [soil metagenome]